MEYLHELSQPDYAADILLTTFGHSCTTDPANIIDLKFPQCIAALEHSKQSWQVGREDGVPHQVNYLSGDKDMEDETLSPPYTWFS